MGLGGPLELSCGSVGGRTREDNTLLSCRGGGECGGRRRMGGDAMLVELAPDGKAPELIGKNQGQLSRRKMQLLDKAFIEGDDTQLQDPNSTSNDHTRKPTTNNSC